MSQWIRRLFFQLNAKEIAQIELREAEIRLLNAMSHREYAEAMVSQYTQSVYRLNKYLEGK